MYLVLLAAMLDATEDDSERQSQIPSFAAGGGPLKKPLKKFGLKPFDKRRPGTPRDSARARPSHQLNCINSGQLGRWTIGQAIVLRAGETLRHDRGSSAADEPHIQG